MEVRWLKIGLDHAVSKRVIGGFYRALFFVFVRPSRQRPVTKSTAEALILLLNATPLTYSNQAKL